MQMPRLKQECRAPPAVRRKEPIKMWADTAKLVRVFLETE
jgi:hypothetical protein